MVHSGRQRLCFVVADTARLAHAAGRKDDLGHRVGVDGIRDSSLVMLTRSPGTGWGMMFASRALISSSKQEESVSWKMRVASMASGLSMYTGKQPWPVTRFFFFISRMK